MSALVMLARALSEAERRAIARQFASALRSGTSFQPPATAFVSLYERGRVIGCVGHADFASALGAARSDPRFGGARGDPGAVTVQLSMLVRGKAMTPGESVRAIELGTHGLVALDGRGAILAVLLPDVARDLQRDAAGMLASLTEKARAVSSAAIERVMLVRSERFVARAEPLPRSRRGTGIRAAASWLAARVDAEGAIAFGLDARSERLHRSGPFHLGRSAIAIEALAAHGAHAQTVRRARAWLSRVIREALEDEAEGLPRRAAERAGTLALATRAGIEVRDMLAALVLAETDEVASQPWHAAQVCVVLAGETPAAVRAAALAPIDAGAWAPWSALAAMACGDARRARTALARVASSVPTRGPHRGGVRLSGSPEVAITALSVEVLARGSAHVAAQRRALEFLEAQQITSDSSMSAALAPGLALGAFPLAPQADFLRTDVTAHALLALLAGRAHTV